MRHIRYFQTRGLRFCYCDPVVRGSWHVTVAKGSHESRPRDFGECSGVPTTMGWKVIGRGYNCWFSYSGWCGLRICARIVRVSGTFDTKDRKLHDEMVREIVVDMFREELRLRTVL